VGTIFSLANWVRDSGQWTATERGRLEALTDQFPGGAKLEVVFGAADDGAPWCAVTNEDGEVLLHVARVANQFLVHVAADDVVSRGGTLREALGRWLSPEPERHGVVVPFARLQNGQDMLILVAIATLLEEKLRDLIPQTPDGEAWWSSDAPMVDEAAHKPLTLAHVEAADEAGRDTAKAEAPALAAATALTPEPASTPDQVAARAAEQVADHAGDHAQSAAAAVPAQTAETAYAAEPAFLAGIEVDAWIALALQTRTGGGQVLAGGSQAEHLVGGDGDDILIGGGGADVLDGGAGDDWIVLASQVLASGGTGADTFVVSAPEVMDHADTLLGTVLDFRAQDGDRLLTAKGEVIAVPPWDEAAEAPPIGARGAHKVEVDVDGNGRVDGYVLVSPGAGDPYPDPSQTTPNTDHSGWTDIIG
jgi:hypothetical protein